MFLHVSVILSTGWGRGSPGPYPGGLSGGVSRPIPRGKVGGLAGGAGSPGPGGGCIPACTEADTPSPPQQKATAADGTYPTGMHSGLKKKQT